MKKNIKPKQYQILNLIYRFRFLNRKQIQQILNHKNHYRTQEWLKDLIQNKFINQYYDNNLATTPAIFSLASNGRKCLKESNEFKIEILNRVWRESKYSIEFKEHCLTLASVYINLNNQINNSKSKLFFYTKVDLYDIGHLIKPYPDAYFAIENNEGIKRYFLDIFDDLPPSVLRKRVSQYFEYFNSDEWQDNTDREFPEIILVCPNRRLKNHLFYYIQNKLGEEGPSFYLAVKEMILSKGLCREVLQKVEPKE